MSSTGVSENPTFKLYYFDIKALGEPIRFLFAYGGQKYEDVRVAREDWPTLKPTMPMGQMPVLEIDGHRVHQSTAIARFLAQRFGLTGSNDWENLIIDTAVETIIDLRKKISAVAHESDAEIKAKKHNTLITEVIPFYLEKLESIVKENDGHLALSKLTWADLYFAGIIDTLVFQTKIDLLEKYPGLRGLVDAVNELESIKAWIRK